MRQATESPDRWNNIAPCWLVDSPSGDFVEIYRSMDWPQVVRRTPVEKSKAIHNFFIDKVRTAYITTIAYDGTVNHRQVLTGGRVRWHRAFPAETKIKVDVDGNTYALQSTATGVVVARYDNDFNLVATTTLPLSIGRRIDAWTFEPLRYLMLVTSRPTSTGRAAFLVRLNPSLDYRVQPIDGNLEPSAPVEIAGDRAQFYICSTTTGPSPQEVVQAFDTVDFASRWRIGRPFEPGESHSELYPNQFGLLTTNNRSGRGVSRKYVDLGFMGFTKRAIFARGGSTVSLGFEWYDGIPEFRTMRFTSSDPIRCHVPSTYTFSGARGGSISADLSAVSVRTRYRVTAFDPFTGVTRAVTLIVDP